MSKLEALVDDSQSKKKHHINPHPHEFLANHVLLVAFISLMFLGSIFSFMYFAVPSDTWTTGHALIEYPQVDLNVGDNVAQVKDTLLDSSHRSEFMYLMYIAWILIMGVINLYMVEREHDKKMKK